MALHHIAHGLKRRSSPHYVDQENVNTMHALV
jgi:hypothetical protein